MTDEAAEPSVDTAAKIVSLGLNVSVGDCTFLSAPTEVPRETSVIVTAGAGVGTAVGGAGAAVGSGGGAGASFLHATRLNDRATKAATRMLRVGFFIGTPSARAAGPA